MPVFPQINVLFVDEYVYMSILAYPKVTEQLIESDGPDIDNAKSACSVPTPDFL